MSQDGLFGPPPPPAPPGDPDDPFVPIPEGNPSFKDDYFGWGGAWLRDNTHVYRVFRDHGNRLWERGELVTANRVLQDLRHETPVADNSGTFKINDHAAPFLIRFYLIEHPGRKDSISFQKKGHWKADKKGPKRMLQRLFKKLKDEGKI